MTTLDGGDETSVTEGHVRRRLFRRVQLHKVVRLAHDERIMRSRTDDISEGGIRLATDQLPVGTSIRVFVPPLQAQVHPSRIWSFPGEVVWQRDGASGVRFIDPPAGGLRLLRQYLSAKSR